MNKLFFSDIDMLSSTGNRCVGETTYNGHIQYIMNKLKGGVPPEDVVNLVEHLLDVINEENQEAYDFRGLEMDVIMANNDMENIFSEFERTIRDNGYESYSESDVLDIISELKLEMGYRMV